MRQSVLDIASVAALMDSAQTQLTNNYLVALGIVLFKADITYNIVFN